MKTMEMSKKVMTTFGLFLHQTPFFRSNPLDFKWCLGFSNIILAVLILKKMLFLELKNYFQFEYKQNNIKYKKFTYINIFTGQINFSEH